MTNGAATAATLTLAPSGGTATFSGVIGDGSGGVSLAINGSGTQVLKGSNTFSGATTVFAGTLNLSNQNALQNSTLTMAGGALALDQSVAAHAFTVGGLAGSGNIALQDNAAVPDSVALTVGGNNASTTFSGALSGLGSLTKSGSGVLALGGNDTYNGPTAITSGTLKLLTSAILDPTAATAQSWYSPRLPGNTIDGAGMIPNNPVALTSICGTVPDNMWLSAGNTNTWIAFNLGSVQTITGFHLWNYNEGSGSFWGRGVQNATMYVGATMPANLAPYANQGPSWGTSAGSFTFAEATGAGYTGTDYTFAAPVTTQYVELYVGSNFGTSDTYTGISQILFESNSNLPVGSPVQLASGAALDLNGESQQILSLNDYVSGSQGMVTNGAATPATLMLAPSGGTAIFSGSIGDGSGGVSLTINGNGTQVLAGSNTYSGATTISAGTLQVGNGGGGASIGSTSGVLNNASLVFNHNDGVTFSPVISGSGSLTQTGPGMLTLLGGNTYSGATIVSGGTLQVGNGGGGASIGSTSGVLNNGSLVFNHNDAVAFSPAISGSGSLTQTGNGLLTLAGGNTYSGATVIAAGTLQLNGLPTPQVAFNFNSVSGNTVNNAGSLSSAYNATLSGGASIAAGVGPNGGNAMSISTGTATAQWLQMNQSVSLASGSWTASAWFYGLYNSPPNSYGYETLFSSSPGADHQVIIVPGGNLATYVGYTTYGPSPAVSMSSYFGLPAWNQITAVGSGGTTSLYIDGNLVGSTIAESTSNISTIGAYINGTQQFAQYIADVDIYQSALSAAQVKSLYAISPNNALVLPALTPVQIASGAALDLNGSAQQVASLNDYVSGSQGTVTNSGTAPATLTLAPGGGTATFSGSIGDGSGGVSLVLNGAGTQVLAGSNTYSGGTTISSGTLQIGNGTSGEYLASPTISNSGALVFNHADTLTYAGAISGSGQLTEQGGGMLILSGNNIYTGPTTVNAGTLQIGNGTSGEGLTSSITMSNNAAVAFNHADPLSYGGAISGSGQLVKLGVGVLDLSGTSTYSGPTTISAGTVELDGNGNNLPLATALTIASGGVLDLAGVPLTVGSLSGSTGAIITNDYSPAYASTLTVAPSSGSTTFAGNIIGNDALALSGSGALTLSGTNTYTGGTTVSGGTLDIAAPSAWPAAGW